MAQRFESRAAAHALKRWDASWGGFEAVPLNGLTVAAASPSLLETAVLCTPAKPGVRLITGAASHDQGASCLVSRVRRELGDGGPQLASPASDIGRSVHESL